MKRIRLKNIRSLLGQARGLLLAVYLLFVLFPHFAAITHSHAGEGKAHSHAFVNIHDETLKREVLENMGSAGSGFQPVLRVVEPEEISQSISVERGAQGLRSSNSCHTHFQEDPNLLALGLIPGADPVGVLLRIHPKPSAPVFPQLEAIRPAARGPPV